MASNRAKERQEKSQCERGRRRRQQEEKERNTYKRVYLHASTKSKKKPSEECLDNEESPPKKARKDKKENQVFMWTDSGLQLTSNSRKNTKTKEHRPRHNPERGKKAESTALSRKIKFIPSNNEEACDKR